MNRRKINKLLPSIKQEYLDDPNSTQTILGQKYGISRSCISSYFKKEGVRVRKDYCVKLSESQEMELVKEYEAGAKNDFLAKKYNVCSASIHNIVTRGGGKLKSIGGQKQYTCNESFFEVIDSHAKAQILGFLYADGNVMLKAGSATWRIDLQERDQCILEQIAKFVSYNGPFYKKTLKGKNYIKLSICRKKMAHDLAKLGCVPNKGFKIRFPEFLEKQYWGSFLYGYWLGDGWATIAAPRGKYNVQTFYMAFISNDYFIDFCKNLLETELGIKCSIEKHPRSRGISSLRIIGWQCLKFWDFISGNIALKLDRKINKVQEIREYIKKQETKSQNRKSEKIKQEAS